MSSPTARRTTVAMPSLTPVEAIHAAPVVTPTVAATATATSVPATDTEAPTATPSLTPTVPPTATPSPTPTEPPTATATPDTNKYYTVGLGDSLMVIGDSTGIDWRQIAQLNNITIDTMLHPGDKLLLPDSSNSPTPEANTSTPVPPDNTPTPVPAARSTTYTVQFGDSFAGIAEQFGLTWEEVARANGMNQDSMLQPGQQLVIPAPGAPQPTDTPFPTYTPAPKPTSTPPGPTASPVPPAPSFPAPALTSPSDGTPFQGGEHFIELTWQPVDGLPPGAVYQVKIQYLSGGVQQESFFNVAGSSLQVPKTLWNQADQPGRQYTWNVTAVQPGPGGASVTQLSQPSATHSFTWH
jgi:LysM repeat protein